MHASPSTPLARAEVGAMVLVLGWGGLLGAGGAGTVGCGRDEDVAARAATPHEARGSASVTTPDDAATRHVDEGSHAAAALPADADMVRADTAADGMAEHLPDPSNKTRPPPTSSDLDERAGHLLDAIAANDPAKGDDFFFPKAPFIPLKDVGDPARYFDQLLATYHRDIRSLSAERKDWTGAAFVSFELGTPPTWVAPGKEYNKIGYFRTFGGKLRYRVGEKVKELTVSTIISWDGRWYVTHLSPIRH